MPLLDDAALVACMASVDLNPVRARIVARQRYQAARRIRARQPRVATAVLATQGLTAAEAGPEVGLWLAPIARCCVALAGSAPEEMRHHGWSAEDYLQLVDLSGRVLRGGKRGAIPAELAPLLARLDLDVDAWVAVLFGWRSFVGRAVGGFAARAAQAGRLSLAWIKNYCPLFVVRAA